MAYANGFRYYVIKRDDEPYEAEARSGPGYRTTVSLLTGFGDAESGRDECEKHAAANEGPNKRPTSLEAVLNEVKKLSGEYGNHERYRYATDYIEPLIDFREYLWISDHLDNVIEQTPEDSKEEVVSALRQIWMNSSMKDDDWFSTSDEAHAAIEALEKHIADGASADSDEIDAMYDQLTQRLSPPDRAYFSDRIYKITKLVKW